AAEAYQAAIELDPAHVFSYRRQIGILREHLASPLEAQHLLDEAVRQNPESIELRLLRADGLVRKGRFDEALVEAEAARQIDPQAVSPLLMVVRIVTRLDTPDSPQFQQLKQDLLDAIDRESFDLRILLALAEMEFRSGDIGETRNWLAKGLELEPKQADFLALGCLAALREKDLEEATRYQAQLDDIGVGSEVSKCLDGLVLVANHRFGDAVGRLESIRNAFDSGTIFRSELDRALLRCYRTLDAGERATALLRESLNRREFSTQARRRYAEALAADGKTSQAISQYREMDRADQDALPLARLLIRRKLVTPGQSFDSEEVARLLTTADEYQPGTPEIAVLRMIMHVFSQQEDAARQTLAEAREQIGNCVELDVAAIQFELQLGRHDAAREALAVARSRYPDRIEVWDSALTLALVTGAADEQELAGLEAAIARLDASVQGVALARLAQVYRRRSQFGDELRLRQDIANRTPESLVANRELVQAALHTGDHDVVRAAIDRLRQIEGERGSHWRSGGISLALAELDDSALTPDVADEMTRQIDELEQIAPDWPVVWAHRGVLALRQRRQRQAVRHLQRAYDQGYRPAGLIEMLARLRIARGELDEAEEILGSDSGSRLSRASASGVGLLGAVALARSGDSDRARALARDAIRNDPGQPRGYLLLARLNQSDGRLDAAEKLFRKAVEVGGDSGVAWVSLIRFLNQHRSSEAAKQSLDELVARDDVNLLTLAQACEACRELETAEQHYVELERRQSGDATVLRAVAEYRIRRGQIPRAETIMQKLVRFEEDEFTAERLWAVRRLAELYEQQGTLDGFRQALDLLEGESEVDLGPGGQRQLARMLARRPERNFVERARELLVRLDARDSLGPADRVQLCRVLDRLGEDDACKLKWAEVLDENGDDPNVCNGWLSRLLDQGRIDDARVYAAGLPVSIRRLPGMAPLLVRLSLIRGDVDAAVEHVSSIDFSTDGKTPRQIRELAGVLNRIAGDLRAEDAIDADERSRLAAVIDAAYQELLAAVTGLVPDYVDFLASEGHADVAWQQLMKNDESGLPVLMQGTIAILRHEDSRGNDVNEWIERLAERVLLSDAAGSIAFEQLAQIRDLQGDIPAAEKQYRAALRRNPDNVFALNNLAWLMVSNGGDLSQARQFIDRALEHAGRYPWLLDTLAQVQLAGGDPDGAMATLEEALEIDADGHRHFLVARVYESQGRNSDAAEQFEIARQLGLGEEDLHRLERPDFEQFVSRSKPEAETDSAGKL
ncbi:MAG: tetratricopeptide repeat protein, partial [Maioricimonas sp. JB045]